MTSLYQGGFQGSPAVARVPEFAVETVMKLFDALRSSDSRHAVCGQNTEL